MQPKESNGLDSLIMANHVKQGFAYLRSEEKHYVFLEPWRKVWADSNGSYSKTKSGIKCFESPWGALEEFHAEMRNAGGSLPCAAGYFAYELCSQIENIEPPELDLLNMPLYEFHSYNKLLVWQGGNVETQDLGSRESFWKMSPAESETLPAPRCEKLDLTLDQLEAELTLGSNFNGESYSKCVSDLIDMIRAGKVYQVNLSQQFDLPFSGSAFELHAAMAAVNPASRGAFLNSEGKFIISSSPELFLKSKEGSLLTSPIKGTKLREGRDQEEITALLHSEKNLAELAMIVDIERNDMGKIAEIGSVEVLSYPRIESTEQLHHLVADVCCKPLASVSFIDLMRAVFPSGSITGAPKIAAMKLISKMEKRARGVYTGSIGWMAGNGDFEFNVAIRTAQIVGERLYFNAGGGVVYDSDPREEYLESLAKTKGFYLAYKSNVMNKY